MSALTHFSCLDELTQVIYQGVSRFVVLSSITDAEWILHVGLVDSQGRWWQGRWAEDNVLGIFGAKASGTLLESFAETLRDGFVKGELYIGNWKPDKGVDINLTFIPASVQLPLREIDPSEAAAYATKVFLEIALQAQTRECRLHPSAYGTNATASTWIPPAPTKLGPHMDFKLAKYSRLAQPTGAADLAAEKGSSQDTGATRRTEPESSEHRATTSEKAMAANPNKKARKYAAIEYESDD